MSRQIDTTTALTADEKAYLAQRARTPEQEADRQAHVARIADTVAHDQDAVSERVAYVGRNPGRI